MTRSPDQEDSMDHAPVVMTDDDMRDYAMNHSMVASEAAWDAWLDAHNERVHVNALDSALAKLKILRDVHAEDLGNDSPIVEGMNQAVALIRKSKRA